MSVRETVLNTLKTTVSSVAGLKAVKLVFEATVKDLETLPYPFVVLYPSSERAYPIQTIGYEVWEWDIVVELWGKEKTNIEGLIADITQALYSVSHANINGIKRTGVEYLYPEEDLYGARITFTVIYTHPFGSP